MMNEVKKLDELMDKLADYEIHVWDDKLNEETLIGILDTPEFRKIARILFKKGMIKENYDE